MLHRLGLRSLEKAAPPPAREKDSEEQREQKRARGSKLLCEWCGRSGVVLPGREEALETNPKKLVSVGCAKENTKAPSHYYYYSGDEPQGVVDQWGTQLAYGPLALGCGKEGQSGLFIELLEELPRTYTAATSSCTWRWTRRAATPEQERVEKYVEDFREGHGDAFLAFVVCGEQPRGVLVWWSLHEAVSRNHRCEGLDDLVEFAEGYLKTLGVN